MAIPASSRRCPGQPASRLEPAELSDEQLAGFVMSPLARCAVTDIGPDEWFPVATVAKAARAEAACALALCAACPVRAECLELSLRHWCTIGRYGIWGGLVETERAAAHQAWLAGVNVTALLASAPRGRCDSGDRPRRLGFSPRRPLPHRDAGQLDPRGDAELAEDLAQVEGHRMHTDEHLVSRLLVGQPL
jgi:WhiB family transcriptional regulator, redox-sensing transcriptional regulator